jgi:hypothetical protein
MTTNVLFSAHKLQNTTQLGGALVQLRGFFAASGIPAPPLPRHWTTFPACDVVVSENTSDHGSRIGTIKFTGLDGRVLFEREWIIAEAKT